jgi:hypothetical protein
VKGTRPKPRHIGVTGARDSVGVPDKDRCNRDHDVPVTPDERALSSWSFLNQMLFNGAFLGGFFRVLSLAVVPRDEGPGFPGLHTF